MLCSFIFFQIFRAHLFFGAHTVFHSAHTKQALRGNVEYHILLQFMYIAAICVKLLQFMYIAAICVNCCNLRILQKNL